MKIQIISIGKKHDKYLEDYIGDFEKRIKPHLDLEWNIISSVNEVIDKKKCK